MRVLARLHLQTENDGTMAGLLSASLLRKEVWTPYDLGHVRYLFLARSTLPGGRSLSTWWSRPGQKK